MREERRGRGRGRERGVRGWAEVRALVPSRAARGSGRALARDSEGRAGRALHPPIARPQPPPSEAAALQPRPWAASLGREGARTGRGLARLSALSAGACSGLFPQCWRLSSLLPLSYLDHGLGRLAALSADDDRPGGRGAAGGGGAGLLRDGGLGERRVSVDASPTRRRRAPPLWFPLLHLAPARGARGAPRHPTHARVRVEEGMEGLLG